MNGPAKITRMELVILGLLLSCVAGAELAMLLSPPSGTSDRSNHHKCINNCR